MLSLFYLVPMGASSGVVYNKCDGKDMVFCFGFFIRSYPTIYLYKSEVIHDV